MLEVCNVDKSYRSLDIFSGKKKQILHQVSFNINEGECLGIIGESGSGKSTLGRMVLGIERPDRGEVLLDKVNVVRRDARKGKITAVFQDYTSSIDPYYTVYATIEEGFLIMDKKPGKDEMRKMVTDLLKEVGLSEEYLWKFPHELSGGEAQRVCIARAIATDPRLILLDEAISSLDASVAYQILVLLKELKEKKNVSFLFISHYIQAVAFLCDRVAFFNDGRILEIVDVWQIGQVKDEYSKKLLASVITL